jgi:hypothetical protein
MEMQDARVSRDGMSFTVTTVVYYPPSLLSAAQVTALSSEKHAQKTRIASDSFRSSDIGSDAIDPDFGFKSLKSPFKFSWSREAPMVDLCCPCLVSDYAL